MQLTRINVAETFDNIVNMLPDKVRIFMIALYIWTWLLFYLTKFANFMLMLVITYLPRLFTPSVKPKTPITIIKAVNEFGVDITKKLNLFMKFKWDEEICDGRGGIDLDTFTEYISSSIIWISYIVNYDIDDMISKNFIKYIQMLDSYKDCQIESNIMRNEQLNDNTSDQTEVNENGIPLDYFKKCIRFIVIITSKKIVYKLKRHTEVLEKEEILFGEIDMF
ncbi:MAG: hypothetical protein ACRCZI_13150 [Cetobacterium sp.]